MVLEKAEDTLVVYNSVPETAWRYTRGISPWCPRAVCWRGPGSVCSSMHPFHPQTSAHPPNSPPQPQQQGVRSDPWVINEYVNIYQLNRKQTVLNVRKHAHV